MTHLFKASTDAHEFQPLLVEIEDAPLNPLGRAVFWIVIAAFVFFGAWMFFGKVDVVVTARGKIIPTGEVKTVQPLTTGVVRAIHVRPGDGVRAGDPIMEIDPSDTEPELSSMKSDLEQVRLEVRRVMALLEGTELTPPEAPFDRAVFAMQREIYRSARAQRDGQIRIKRQELAQIAERLAAEEKALVHIGFLLGQAGERLKRLKTVQDLISRDEFDTADSEVHTQQEAFKRKTHAIAELSASRQRILREIDLIESTERRRLLDEFTEKRQKEIYLEGRIEKADFITRRQQIVSPVDGTVAQVLVHTIGGVVTPAEKLAHIVPSDAPLVVKALLPDQDVGFVTTGMPVSVKVDTFSFQKYGIIDGTVVGVSSDSIEDRTLGLVYEAYIRPERTTLMVEGKKTAITAGMGVTAEVKIGKRRIIEFFIYPLIKYLDVGVSVR